MNSPTDSAAAHPREVYALYYFEPASPDDKRYFYVGQSIQVLKRMRQHAASARTGHEDKYEFIRELDSRGLDWHHEVLCTVGDEQYDVDAERWFVIKLTRAGFRLMNMRYGSVAQLKELTRQIASPQIRNVFDVRRERVQAKYAASKRQRRKILKATLKTEGIPDVRLDTVLPPILRRRLLADANPGPYYIEPGLSIGEIVKTARARPMLRRLQAKVDAHQGGSRP